jgi:hypothetical protein
VVMEVDKMWHFIKKKHHKLRVCYVRDRDTGRLLLMLKFELPTQSS